MVSKTLRVPPPIDSVVNIPRGSDSYPRRLCPTGLPVIAASILFTLAGCRVTSLPLWHPLESAAEVPCEVKIVRDVPYASPPESSAQRQRLDLFVPRDTQDFPVVVFVHGGAWMIGDNRCCGLYSSVGEFLAGQGIGVVMPNYRLSPGDKHPTHAQDVARAVAWTKSHARSFGGRTDQLILMGHSAGGHLVALLSTDEQYLQAEGLSLDDIKGTIGISGVYEVSEEQLQLTLGGTGNSAFHLQQVIPLRGGKTPPAIESVSIPIALDAYALAFDDDPAIRQDASPLTHVRSGLSPFLLISAEQDLPTLSPMADDFCNALRKARVPCRRLIVPNRNHNSIMFTATERKDPVARAILEFVAAHTTRRVIAAAESRVETQRAPLWLDASQPTP